MADYHTDNAVFLVYKDWESLFDSLDSNEEAGELIKALFAFAKRGEIAEFSGALKMAFIFMSQQLERDGQKWEQTCNKRSEYGRKGGIAKAEKQKVANASLSQQEPAYAAKSWQKLASVADTDTETEKETDTDTDTEKEKESKKAASRFKPPSLTEVRDYCFERGNNVDAERFVDHYTANGWMIGGKSKMKDWKAAVRNWERNGWNGYGYNGEKKTSPAKPAQAQADNFRNNSFDDDDLAKLFGGV